MGAANHNLASLRLSGRFRTLSTPACDHAKPPALRAVPLFSSSAAHSREQLDAQLLPPSMGPLPEPVIRAGRAYAAAADVLLAAGDGGLQSPPAPQPEEEDRAEQASAAAAALTRQAQQAAVQIERQVARQAELRAVLEARCADAQAQHEAVAGAVAALADRLACLAPGSAQPPPLLALDLPDSYADTCRTLLDSLSVHLSQSFPPAPTSGGGAAAAQRHQAAVQELQQLQRAALLAERQRVQDEAELAR